MIVVDTSIWADHFRRQLPMLSKCLANGDLAQHPFVTGELVLGNPPDRIGLRRKLEGLPQIIPIGHDALLDFAFEYELGGVGVGYVDTHLLASSKANGARLWTRDKRLLAQAERLDIAFEPEA